MSEGSPSPHPQEEGSPSPQPQEEGSSAYEPAISAKPPKVRLQEESQVEVSASPAFQCLDDLFQDGKLTGTRVAQLKAKYTELHETLKSTHENEKRLLQQAKQFRVELESQQIELEKADEFPENINNEVMKLREQLLKYQNELMQTEERQYQLDYTEEGLKEDKKHVDREYSRMPKAGEIEKRLKELQTTSDELRKEIGQRQSEIKNLKEDLEEKQHQHQIDRKDVEMDVDEMEKLKAELVAVNSLPNQLSKEADKLQRQKVEVDRNKKTVDSEFGEYVENLRNLESRRTRLDDERQEIDKSLEKQKSIIESKEREFDVLMKQNDFSKEREAVLIADRATLDVSLRHIGLERKNLHELHSRKMREKDRDLRSLKKSELQLKVATEALQHTKSVYDKVKSLADAQPKDDGTLFDKRKELIRDVDQNKRNLAQQNSMTAVEQVKVEQSIAEEERLLYEQSDLRIEVVELTRLAAIKADEREQKARDFMRAELRFTRANEDLKTKKLQIQDNQKKYQEMEVRKREFAKLYDVIKNERNKCVNLIQTSTQKAAEMREKIKILSNEIEILRTAACTKERQLQKQRLKHLNSIVVRDSLRNEVAKQHRVEDEMKEDREQLRMDIAKLNAMINQAEEQMVGLRKKYETAVQHRNDRGVQLIERNEEVCIFYEKVNIQEQMIRNGDVEMSAREEEIRFLNMQAGEENRNIELMRKNIPHKRNAEDELATLQIQLSECQDRLIDLEDKLENPNDENRVRYLSGKDPTPAEMSKKIEELEVRLSEKEENLLEKDLIFEQVTRLADRVKSNVDSGKEDTLSLAKKVNELQARIKETTRKMMSLVSELSMKQAESMRLQQVVKEQESDLEEQYTNMEKGEPPSQEIEMDWEKRLRLEIKQIRDRQHQRMLTEEEEQYVLPGGVSTTAEPRPNAYIPDEESDIPVPRPYGSHAPFKPSEPGSTMRHIRKPIPKPIEI